MRSRQAGFHILVTTISLVFAVITGGITGAILRNCADPMAVFYEDGNDWNVPDEYEEQPEFEDAVAR